MIDFFVEPRWDKGKFYGSNGPALLKRAMSKRGLGTETLDLAFLGTFISQNGVYMIQRQGRYTLSSFRLILDSCSTFSVFPAFPIVNV